MMRLIFEQLIAVLITVGFVAGLAMTIDFIRYLYKQIQKLLRHDRDK
ncbi:hypothetical protein B879_04153 [Cecembia lonarensis LW9]|uniref:Uncharacterized protein n=1 Tax=Cecembia lonarensis (strain CCUG 58316 / KCTC 22772 / LW9) TaxID=1225176 RepID=K1LA66_CECL9|nr:hypothetical protein B879_04153 [Cecembia lonarensis LW9]